MITMRKSLLSHVNNRAAMEPVHLKLIDTSSKHGKGRFQSTAEKKAFFGPTKREKQKILNRKNAAAAAKVAGGDKAN